jgi:hypothetical protein
VDNKDNPDMVKDILVEETEEDIEIHLVMNIKVKAKEVLSEEDSVEANAGDSVEGKAQDFVRVLEALPVEDSEVEIEVFSNAIVKMIIEEHHLKLYFNSI